MAKDLLRCAAIVAEALREARATGADFNRGAGYLDDRTGQCELAVS